MDRAKHAHTRDYYQSTDPVRAQLLAKARSPERAEYLKLSTEILPGMVPARTSPPPPREPPVPGPPWWETDCEAGSEPQQTETGGATFALPDALF